MIENKMYSDRVKNIPVMRYCDFNCVYCAFQKFQKISKCQQCRDNTKHSHLEVLERTPPNTKLGQFLTVGLSGDVSFMKPVEFYDVLEYCREWYDRTFFIQSKKPSYFLQFGIIPDNVILGTTIETDNDMFVDDDYFPYYPNISSAPLPRHRYTSMKELKCRKAITIEPILSFDSEILLNWIEDIHPEFVYIGYANDHYEGGKFKLPEPKLEKTLQLIQNIKQAGIEVREKTLRNAWWDNK